MTATAASKKRGWQNAELPLATGRCTIHRAARPEEGAQHHYSWCESLPKPPKEGFMRYLAKTWGVGRYRVTQGEVVSNINVDEGVVKAVTAQAPAAPAANDDESDVRVTQIVESTVAPVEAALQARIDALEAQIAEMGDRMEGFFADLAQAEAEAEAEDTERAENPSNPVEALIQQKELVAEAEAVFSSSKSGDIMATITAGLNAFSALRGAGAGAAGAAGATSAAANPPGELSGEDEQWAVLLGQVKAMGIKPHQVQEHLVRGLRAGNAAPAQS